VVAGILRAVIAICHFQITFHYSLSFYSHYWLLPLLADIGYWLHISATRHFHITLAITPLLPLFSQLDSHYTFIFLYYAIVIDYAIGWYTPLLLPITRYATTLACHSFDYAIDIHYDTHWRHYAIDYCHFQYYVTISLSPLIIAMPHYWPLLLPLHTHNYFAIARAADFHNIPFRHAAGRHWYTR